MTDNRIAYYMGWGLQLIITGINYDIDDSVTFYNETDKKHRRHTSKIRYNLDGSAYFITYGHRIRLDECIRF